MVKQLNEKELNNLINEALECIIYPYAYSRCCEMHSRALKLKNKDKRIEALNATLKEINIVLKEEE
jgi:hypothetical protein